MNWLKKTIRFGEKIKTILKKRPTQEEIASSDWTSCCKGPILKKDLEEKTGLNVSINNKKNNSGVISFEYKDLDQLDKLIDTIKKNY